MRAFCAAITLAPSSSLVGQYFIAGLSTARAAHAECADLDDVWVGDGGEAFEDGRGCECDGVGEYTVAAKLDAVSMYTDILCYTLCCEPRVECVRGALVCIGNEQNCRVDV